jgi:hypothetical protein
MSMLLGSRTTTAVRGTTAGALGGAGAGDSVDAVAALDAGAGDSVSAVAVSACASVGDDCCASCACASGARQRLEARTMDATRIIE